MKITVNGDVFSLQDGSLINLKNRNLIITEPGFDERTSILEKSGFPGRPVGLPLWLDEVVSGTIFLSNSNLYADKKGRKKFKAYLN